MTRRFQHLGLVGLLVALLAGPLASTNALAVDPNPAAEPMADGASSAAPGRVAPVSSAPSVPSGSTAAAATEPAPAQSAATTSSDQAEPVAESTTQPTFLQLDGGTTVSPEHFYSPILGKSTWYEVILPPGYETTNRHYPVVYMLHGAMGGAHEWIEIGIHKAADKLWSEGEIEPFIIVLPEGGMLNYWLNHADGGPRYGDYVVEDVVHEIDSHYRTLATPRSRAIGGLSMGGDGALRLALTNPDAFGIAGAHSPTTRLRYEDRPGAFYGDFGYWQQNNSLWLLRNTENASRLQIWIDVGDQDPWVFSGRELHQALLDQDVEHVYAELPGEHAAEYWEGYQEDYLRFYSEAFGGHGLAAQPTQAAGESE